MYMRCTNSFHIDFFTTTILVVVVVVVVVLKVISTLKKITIQESIVGEGEEEGEDERAVTSLDKPHDRNTSSPRYIHVVSAVYM